MNKNYYLKEQKPAEWSDEDYVMQRAALEILMASPKLVASTILKESVIVWLKSIKDRIQPQPKQEWTEEDERRLNSLKCAIMCYQEQHPFTTDAKGDMEWVNNFKERLYPQRRWIPTEEQKRKVFNILKGRNLRFISPLNKLAPIK